jgi:hypothetical protein
MKYTIDRVEGSFGMCCLVVVKNRFELDKMASIDQNINTDLKNNLSKQYH